MEHLDLFSGIGGFALAASWVWGKEHKVISFVELDPFCQAVLRKHWPGVPIHGDIRTFANADGARQQQSEGHHKKSGGWIGYEDQIDLLTGGFPCQPYSHAGQRRGTEDDRALWPEMHRVIRLTKPRWIVAENVRGLLSIEGGMVFEQVLSDLEALNYETQAFVIPACAVNAPHRRDRVWIVAHREGARLEGRLHIGAGSGKPEGEIGCGNRNDPHAQEPGLSKRRHEPGERSATERFGVEHDDRLAPDTEHTTASRQRRNGGEVLSIKESRLRGEATGWDEPWIEVAARLCTLDDGLPGGLVRPRGWRNAALKGAGNAIVPQVAAEIFRAIKTTDEGMK